MAFYSPFRFYSLPMREIADRLCFLVTSSSPVDRELTLQIAKSGIRTVLLPLENDFFSAENERYFRKKAYNESFRVIRGDLSSPESILKNPVLTNGNGAAPDLLILRLRQEEAENFFTFARSFLSLFPETRVIFSAHATSFSSIDCLAETTDIASEFPHSRINFIRTKPSNGMIPSHLWLAFSEEGSHITGCEINEHQRAKKIFSPKRKKIKKLLSLYRKFLK